MVYRRNKSKPINVFWINIYAPTEFTAEDKRVKYIRNLNKRLTDYIKKFIQRDFNTKGGKEDYIKQVAGKITLPGKTNNNGQRLGNLVASRNMIFKSTKFEHPNMTKLPRYLRIKKHGHILLKRRKQTSIS